MEITEKSKTRIARGGYQNLKTVEGTNKMGADAEDIAVGLKGFVKRIAWERAYDKRIGATGVRKGGFEGR